MEKIDPLFERAISFWPNQIDIADGKFIDEISGFKSDNLTQAWDTAEQKSLGQDWNELSVWVIYKMLHQRAMKDFKLKSFYLYPSELNKEEFKGYLSEELQQEGYEQMFKELHS